MGGIEYPFIPLLAVWENFITRW